jgi:hypothetical protein
MRQNNNITQNELKQLMDYNPETGVFNWLVNRGGPAKAGTVAGRLNSDGHRQISVNNKRYMAHRLAWLYTYGEFPECQIDHKNGEPDDNSMENLRLTPRNQKDNTQNRKKASTNSTGYIGVTKNAWNFVAQIQINGKKVYLGSFKTKELAYEARLKAQKELWVFQPEPRR